MRTTVRLLRRLIKAHGGRICLVVAAVAVAKAEGHLSVQAARTLTFLACFIASYFVSHAYAVRIARALESGGRLRGRGTILLGASPLALINFVVVYSICASLNIPVMESTTDTSDVAVAGGLLFACAFGTGTLALVIARHLPARRRARPRQRVIAIIGRIVAVLAGAAVPVIAITFLGALVIGLRGHPPHGAASWLTTMGLGVPLVVVGIFVFGGWTKTGLSKYAQQLRSSSEPQQTALEWTLYLRPFDEERRLFAGTQTFEEFLGCAEFEDVFGPLVALGNPTDRIAPVGAIRSYHDDEGWRAEVERLALGSSCIVGMTGSSASTAWELQRILELGLEQQLFLMTPPPIEPGASQPIEVKSQTPPRRGLTYCRDLWRAYVHDNTDEISRLVSFGELPAAWSPAGVTVWPGFVAALTECGYTVGFEDPGPGSVLGFDHGGAAAVLATGLSTQLEYMESIEHRLAEIVPENGGGTGPVANERFVQCGAERLYVRDLGDGVPIVVLHGGPDFDHEYLLPDMDRLADSFRLVYYDQRGRGRSFSGTQPDVTMATEVDDLDRVRESFGFESIAVLGHSWGGLLAMEYTIRHPERVSHLILMNTAPASHADVLILRGELSRSKSPAQTARMDELRSDPRFQAGDIATEAEYYRIHYGTTLRNPEHLEAVIGRLRAAFSKKGIVVARAIEDRLYEDTWTREEYDLIPALCHLDIPTLIIWGDDDFVPRDVIDRIADAISSARTVVIPDCGHFAYLEQPDETRRAISAFMTSASR